MEVYTWTPDYVYSESIAFSTQITGFASGVEQRRRIRSRGLRTFQLKYNLLDQSEINEIWDFFIARYGQFEAFKFRNYPNEYQNTLEAVGTGDSTNDSFYLDKSYIVDPTITTLSPIAIAPKIYVNGVLKIELTHYTLDYEVGKITFTGGNEPGSGLPITATYEFYYKVRFSSDTMNRELFEVMLYRTGLNLKELFP